MKQETETTQTDQVTRDNDIKDPYLFVGIKQEIDYETSDETRTEDLKINVSKIDRDSMNMTEMETVPQTGLCGQDERKHIKDEIVPHTQSYLTNSHVDIKKEDMDSVNSDQHSQLVRPDIFTDFSERLSEQNINTVSNKGDATEDFKSMSENTGNIVKITENKQGNLCLSSTTERSGGHELKDYRKSVKVMDCQVKDIDLMSEITQNVILNNRDCNKLSANELCASKKEDKHAVSNAGSKIFCSMEASNSKSGVEIPKYLLSRHKTFAGELLFNSNVCNNGSGELNVHTSHTVEKPYKCAVCGVGFTQTGNLNRHKRIHTQEKPYKCDACGAGFTDSGNLNRHKRTHTGEKPYKCDVCGKTFILTGHLKIHKITHTQEKPYKCDVCDVGFTQIGNLKAHKLTHTGEKPYKCDVCGLGFTQSVNLRAHKRIHTGEKPDRCDVCGAVFSHTRVLNRHKRIHTGEKLCKCDVCGAAFTQIDHLTRHKRTHSGEKPYKCDVCGLGFTQTCHLTRHRRIHSGEKPYECDVCGVGFTQTGHLKRHKRTHTGEMPYMFHVFGTAAICVIFSLSNCPRVSGFRTRSVLCVKQVS